MNRRHAVALPEHVRAIDFGTVAITIDERTGNVETLSGTARAVFLALAATGDTIRAARYCGLPVATVERVEAYLTGREILTQADRPRTWRIVSGAIYAPNSWGTTETPACLRPIAYVPVVWLLRAVPALSLTLAVRHLPPRHRRFARILAVIRAATRPTRPASRAEAAFAVRAVRLLARAVPARIACLEESTAAMLALAIAGRRAEWCQGAASDPVRLHAWVHVAGQPVEEPDSTGRYVPVISIPPEGAHDH